MDECEILIVAGEPSGDLHAAPVVAALRRRHPGWRFFGSGGGMMRREGVELFANIEDLAVMGFSSVPRALPRLARLKRAFLHRVEQSRVSLAVLVDYPGFNLNLAADLKRLRHPPATLEYIAPQIWAWRRGRLKKIRRYIDCLAVVFPFEEKLFRDEGVNAVFVGHPLLDELQPYLHEQAALPRRGGLLALLPGSRRAELARHLPIMLQTVRLLKVEIPDLAAGVGKAPNLSVEAYHEHGCLPEMVELWEDSRQLMKTAAAGLVCSGTATLEAALLGLPQAVVYATSPLNYHVIKRLITLKQVGLVNIAAGEGIVPELLQEKFTSERAAAAVCEWLTGGEAASSAILRGYERIRRSLGEAGAAERVSSIAESLVGDLNR